MKEHTGASLRVEGGPNDSSIISLDSSSAVFGRSRFADDATPENKSVSRRHFQIRCHDGVFYISDLDSTNGTYLNGERLQPNVERRVRDADRISLASDAVVLRFVDPVSTVRIDANTPLVGRSPESDDLVVDLASRNVWVRGQLQDPPLPKKEFDILELLYRNRGKAVSRDEIADAGWPELAGKSGPAIPNASIDQNILLLRKRIEVDPASPMLIVTRRSHGYQMPLKI